MSHICRESKYFPIAGLPIGIWRLENQPPTDLHDHDFTEIAIIEKGTGRHLFGKTVLSVSVGDMFVINRACQHAWVETRGLECVNVMLGEFRDIPLLSELQQRPGFRALFMYEPNLRSKQKGRGRLRLDMIQLDLARHFIARLDQALHEQSTTAASVATIQALSLVNLLVDAYTTAQGKHHHVVLRVARAIEYLEAHWHQPTAVEELAKITHVSVPTFYRIFHAATGYNPSNYLNRLRIKHACKLLQTTDLTITEIAFKTGFKDSSYFSHVFSRTIGLSPRAYRLRECGH